MFNPLKIFWQSVSQPAIYTHFARQPFKKSLLYYLSVYGLVSLILGSYIAISLIPDLLSSLRSLSDTLIAHFPTAAVITIHQSHLNMTGTTAPIVIPLPQTLSDLKIPNLVTVNATASSGSLFALDSSGVTVLTDPQAHTTQTTPWPNLNDTVTISASSLKHDLTGTLDTLNRFKSLLYLGFPVSLFVFLGFSRFIFILLYTIPITLLGQATGRPVGYRHLLGVSLHTVIIADTITFIAQILYQSGLSYLFTLAFLGITAIILFSFPKTKLNT